MQKRSENSFKKVDVFDFVWLKHQLKRHSYSIGLMSGWMGGRRQKVKLFKELNERNIETRFVMNTRS